MTGGATATTTLLQNSGGFWTPEYDGGPAPAMLQKQSDRGGFNTHATAAWSILAPLCACRLQVSPVYKLGYPKKLHPVSIPTKPFPSLCSCLWCPNFRHRISHSGITSNASLPAHSFCWSVIHSLNSTKSVSLPSIKSSKCCLCWLNWSNTPSSFCLPLHLSFSQHK